MMSAASYIEVWPTYGFVFFFVDGHEEYVLICTDSLVHVMWPCIIVLLSVFICCLCSKTPVVLDIGARQMCVLFK